MSPPRPNLSHDLTGKNKGLWHVVAYCGELQGVRYWKCMLRGDGPERLVAERDIVNRRVNSLSRIWRPLKEAELDPTGWIYGAWEVVERLDNGSPEHAENKETIYKCRCECLTVKEIPRSDLRSLRTLSCGCRPHDELLAEYRTRLRQSCKGLDKEFMRACRESLRSRCDVGWTREKEQALQEFQQSCVVCGATSDLTTDHVLAVARGGQKKPGNVVRLCRAHNSVKNWRDLSELPVEIADRIRTHAAAFEAHWRSLSQ
jgi:5-methylcytosine-specific restriction endonuclease McrA